MRVDLRRLIWSQFNSFVELAVAVVGNPSKLSAVCLVCWYEPQGSDSNSLSAAFQAVFEKLPNLHKFCQLSLTQ